MANDLHFDDLFLGLVIATLFFCGVFVMIYKYAMLDAKPGKQNCSGIAYIITIDSVATDSLFGKTWRK